MNVAYNLARDWVKAQKNLEAARAAEEDAKHKCRLSHEAAARCKKALTNELGTVVEVSGSKGETRALLLEDGTLVLVEVGQVSYFEVEREEP